MSVMNGSFCHDDDADPHLNKNAITVYRYLHSCPQYMSNGTVHVPALLLKGVLATARVVGSWRDKIGRTFSRLR